MNVFRVVLFVVILVTAGLFALLIFYPHCAYAGANIAITGPTWPVGPIAAEDETWTLGDNWKITNISVGIEDIDISVASTGAWSASDTATPAFNKFGLREDNSGGTIIKTAADTLTTDLLNHYGLDLWFKAPTDDSEVGEHTLTVTLSAVNWRKQTIIYMAEGTMPNGNLGGRSGADTYCANNKPANLPSDCGDIRAWMAMSTTDEVRDMPALYGYISNYPLYWWHSTDSILTLFANNWDDVFDNSILVSQADGTGIAENVMSGTWNDGSVYQFPNYCCNGFTNSTTSDMFSRGSGGLLYSLFNIGSTYPTCNTSGYRIRCICGITSQ